MLLYSLHAGTYLANTRTLLWLRVDRGEPLCRPEDRNELLTTLETQVHAADKLSRNIIELLRTSYDRPCEGYWELTENVTEDIAAIIAAEKEVLQHEQSK